MANLTVQMSNCQVCLTDAKAPYKCPICRISYCTIQCCREHKKIKCTTPDESKPIDPQPEETDCNFSTNDTVSVNRLQLLGRCEELKSILSNKHLRSIMQELDKCKNPNEMLELSMTEPLFTEFVDVCLRVIEDERS